MKISNDFYKSSPILNNLSFDEESLFWRLRLGEGLPSREWHRPFDKSKSWQEIKQTLDQKIHAAKVSEKSTKRSFMMRMVGLISQALF